MWRSISDRLTIVSLVSYGVGFVFLLINYTVTQVFLVVGAMASLAANLSWIHEEMTYFLKK